MNTVSPRVFDQGGTAAELGRELGRGGEGIVYELPSQPNLVAKLYHQTPDAAKQAKLKLMVDSIDSPLREYAAWPEDTLHDENGAVIGFTMQRIERRVPIHMLYSPAQRRETFPSARFDFLVFVARNIAAAFDTLHAHGHVLGDVNQGNVLVGEDSRVILIDCDSFQIQVGDALHRCEVGVAHFTPPELQTVASFEGITRTPNHDGFGLALLIFHLLMGGRHPYSGVPLAEHVGESLEGDIRDFRYAYADDARRRLIGPPPRSVPVASLPRDIVALFEHAFTETGVESRPTARAWGLALDALRAQLVTCALSALHVHARESADCVWCVLERERVSYFGAPLASTPRKLAAEHSTSIDIAALDQQIGAFPAPDSHTLVLPNLQSLPTWEDGKLTALPASALLPHWAVALVAGVVAYGYGSAGWMLLAGAWAYVSMFYVGIRHQEVERSRCASYRAALARFHATRAKLHSMLEEDRDLSGARAMANWKAARQNWASFVEHEQAELAQYKLDAVTPSLRQHLSKQLIFNWHDARLTNLQRTRLSAFGIESAADADRVSLRKAQLLNTEGGAALVAWRDDLIRDFHRNGPRFEPNVRDFQRRRGEVRKSMEAGLLLAHGRAVRALTSTSGLSSERRDQVERMARAMAAAHAECTAMLPEMLP